MTRRPPSSTYTVALNATPPETSADLTRAVPVTLHDRPVLAYIVTTIRTGKAPTFRLHQQGSAPNFDGGRITLCTCKHRERATMCLSGDPSKPWDNVWIAGFTSKSDTPSRSLAYLMLVEKAFPNQQTFWNYLPSVCRREKSAATSILGDLYEPKPTAATYPHSSAQYLPPVTHHVHARCWEKDIELWSSKKFPQGRPHHLLLGHPKLSFRWSSAQMRLNPNIVGKTAHHKIFPTLSDLIAALI